MAKTKKKTGNMLTSEVVTLVASMKTQKAKKASSKSNQKIYIRASKFGDAPNHIRTAKNHFRFDDEMSSF